MSEFRITLVQSDIAWEDPAKNFSVYNTIIDNCSPCDLIVLPEMFISGFSTHPPSEVIESGAKGVDWMKTQANKKSAAICGSLIVSENGKLFNRFLFVTPEGRVFQYDKKHLFSMGGEDEYFSSGKENISIEFRGMRIRPQICYDLRFPVWNRNRLLSDGSFEYDLMVVVANWPEKRINHWEKLLQARAIENQAWVCGVNRVGRDGSGLEYTGNSLLVDPSGDIVVKAPEAQEFVHTFSINMSVIQDIRKRLPFAADWDSFKITEKDD